jgi:periplasmic protein TonB
MDRLADGDAAVRTAVQEALRSLAEASDFRGAATGLSRPPRPIKTERPSYPADALKGRIQGTVLVEFLVTTDGSVTRARVVESVAGLDEAALEAVKRFSFVPAVKDGRLVAAIARAPLVFRLP